MKRAFAKVCANLGLLILLGCPAFWLARGGSTGWTKTSVTRMEVDPVTELEFPVVEKRFVPGVDFLAGTVVVGIGLAAGGMIWGGRRGRSAPSSEPDRP